MKLSHKARTADNEYEGEPAWQNADFFCFLVDGNRELKQDKSGTPARILQVCSFAGEGKGRRAIMQDQHLA